MIPRCGRQTECELGAGKHLAVGLMILAGLLAVVKGTTGGGQPTAACTQHQLEAFTPHCVLSVAA